MHIGEFIAYKRKEFGYTQPQFAEILGVTKQTVSKWEKRLAAPDFITIPTLALHLDVTPEFLANVMWLDLSGNALTHFVHLIACKKRGRPYVVKTYESKDYNTALDVYNRIRQGNHPDLVKLFSGCSYDATMMYSMEFWETTIAESELENAEFPINTLLLDSCDLNSVIKEMDIIIRR